MKRSRYNFFIKTNDGATLAFNSKTGALAEIEKEHEARIEYLLDNAERAETSQDKEFVEGLTAGGYLIGNGIDEVDELECQANSSRVSDRTLSLTIAPTLACNFSCDYCYESRSSLIMSDETQQALLDFADKHLGRISNLLISWFGGEPTLCLSIIEKLQSGLQDLAEKHNVKILPSSIITNGYLLNKEMAERLSRIGINDVQITIDGPPHIHDRRRKLPGGKGTFGRIIDNLAETCDILNFGIRINIDRSNIEAAYQVIEILRDRDILPRVRVYFAQVQSSGEACADIRDRCFGEEEFSHSQIDLYKQLIEKGIYHVDYPEVSGGVICGAVSNRSFVISPTGHIFKCWEEISIDPEKSVGDIVSTEISDQQKANLEKFQTWNPLKLTECRECDILPVCMGGCPIRGINDNDGQKGNCSPWKFNLQEMLQLRYLCEQAREAKV
jgi:uncharacterized protein